MRVLELGLICAALLAGPGASEPGEDKPVKLDVKPQEQSIRKGGEAKLQVTLRNAKNQPVKASKDLSVQVESKSPSGKVARTQVTFKAGETEKEVRLPAEETGITEIRAMQREMLDGGTFVSVKPTASKSLEQSQQPTQKTGARGAKSGREAPERATKPEPDSSRNDRQRLFRRPLYVLSSFRGIFSSESAEAADDSEYQDTPPSPKKPLLTLRYSPQRRLHADSADAATIQAFLLGESGGADADISLRLFASAGRLDPQKLVIRKKDDKGSSILTSDQIGTATVECMASHPAVEFYGGRELKIAFGPPISELSLEASPRIVSLAEGADLIVKLLNHKRQSEPTDEPRQVSLAIKSGRGEVDPKDFAIATGQSSRRVPFYPTWRGEVHLAASANNLADADAFLQVVLPISLLIAAGLGGIAGGAVAMWTGTKTRPVRVLIGLICGFVLYWAFVFGVLTTLPRGVVLNPLSAFALSALGGWLGSEVFTRLVKLLGIAV